MLVRPPAVVALVLVALPPLLGCASSPASEPTNGSDAGGDDGPTLDAGAETAAPLACRDLPAGAKLDTSLPGCTPKAATWTKYNVTLGARPTYVMSCGKTNPPYHDQASFDAGETSGASPGVTVASNHDYFRAATCASGSIELRGAGATSTQLMVWKLEPK